MFKNLLTQVGVLLCLLLITTSSCLQAQQTVFTENFNAPGTPQGPAFTTNGQIGTSKWSVTRSNTGDLGAKIDGGMLTLTNDVSSAANAAGWVMASTPTSNYTTLYKDILSQNVGVVSWTFNMRQIRANPSGLGAGKFGSAFILAGTANTSNSVGRGYAIVLGQNTTTDPIRLVTYYNGLATGTTVRITSSTTGLKDFGAEYTSVRVEYNPAVNKWAMYLRKDNPTSFQDPTTGTLVFQQEVPTSDFINESLPLAGAYWNANIAKLQTAFFDNFSVSVETPELISLDPDSKIANSGAFTLTVNGKGFLPTSKVYWNGALRTTTYVSETQLKAAILPADIGTAATRSITVTNGTFISNALPFTIESGGNPVLTLSATSLSGVSTVTGTASTATNTYTISGANLTASATVTAPPNFEISVDGNTYSNVLTLPYTIGEGKLTGQPITLRARLTSSALAGNYTGNISHTSPNALTKLVAVSGRVYAAEPTTNASSITFNPITSTGFKINWVNGNGAQRLVLVKELTLVSTLPTDGMAYTANVAFGTGSQIGTGNFVVYKGTGTSVSITGLKPDTAYYISIVEFNGITPTENYRSEGATGNTKTLNSPVGLQVKEANTSYKINFDDTVDGVNLDTFQGLGMAQIAETGQLDSDSWAFSGFSGGNIAFGGSSVEDSNNENGPSDGGEDDTGIYAFNVGTPEAPNYTLGIQPGGSGSTNDFNPGSITLRIQNQNATPTSSINIGYKVYVYNDQPSSSKIAFTYSSDQGGLIGFSTSESTLDVISPATADLAPGWKAYYRVKTITGLNIIKDKYFYIKWSGSAVSGTGEKDEFAIDDIEVIANPVASNTVSFDGVAEDFVLQGNASLSDNLSVQTKLHFNGGKLAIGPKTLTIAGKVENTIVNGLTGGATSKLVVRGTQSPTLSFDQSANTLKVLDLFGANANIVTLSNNIIVNDSLKINELQTLNLGTNTLSGTLNNIINKGTILTQNTTATPFASGKTWGGTGILNMNAVSTAQTLVAGTYTNLTLSSASGTTAVNNVTVNGILHLPAANASTTKGSLSMGTFTLTMGPDGINTGIGEVTGIIKRDVFVANKLYTFGHSNSSITFPPAGTLPTSMSAKLTIGTAPTWRAGAILRQFDITQAGAVGTKALIRQHYLDTELNGNTETKLVFWGHKVEGPINFEQGKSSNNTTENWVEISNANVAEYFVNQFDKVYISLDDTQGVGQTTWTGTTSSSWTTATNWTNGKPTDVTKVIIPNADTTPNDPELNPSETIGSLVIETGGIVNATGTLTDPNPQLFLSSGAGAWQNNGTFNPENGNVIFNSIDATISGNTTFNNLTIATGAGLRALEGNKMSIAGTFTNNGTMFTTLIPNTIEFTGTNQIIPDPKGEAFGGYHHLIVSGTGITLASTITTLNVRGNLTLNQTVPFTGKTINFAGIFDQTIGGTAASNFNNLVVNKETGAVILAKDIAVGGTLTLTKGNVVIGANNLTLGSNEVAGTFGINTMIVADGTGVVRRPFAGIGSYLFPIGELDGAPSYAPITVNATAGTFTNAFVGVNVTHAKHLDNKSSQNYLKKYWNVNQTGIAGAVATITATYEPLDVIGSETEIAAAQLNGVFNADTNPWIKFGALTTNTLTATNATLTSGQTSAFTGLKAGAFTLEVYGYGDFCLGSTHTMNAITTGGDAPFTYVWSNGLPNSADVLIPTTVDGTTNYTLTVRDANGFTATDTSIPVYIFPISNGGVISNTSQQICVGTLAADLPLTGSVGQVLHWQKSNVENFSTFENLSNFTTTLTGVAIGPLTETTYFRALVQNGDCEVKYSNVATVNITSTTWNASGWSNSAPDATTSAIFAANYNTSSGTLITCSCLVNAGVTLTVGAGSSITIQNDLINNGNIVVESDGNLIQVNNNGKYIVDPYANPLASFIVNREAIMKRLDYVYWSSPVADQNLRAFSPGTIVTRFLSYDESDDYFKAIFVDESDNTIGRTLFKAGKGYAIRAKNNQNATIPTLWPGQFKGKPNTGDQNFALALSTNGYNLVGNPYSSNIKLNDTDSRGLFNINSEKIHSLAYFWTNVARNVGQMGPAYTGENYAMYNLSGGTSGASGNNEEVPNGRVKVGQGFIVKAKTAGANLTFNNAMRTTDTSIFFDKNASSEKDRFWLKMQTPDQNNRTLLIAYVTGATNGFEYSYDAPLMSLGSDSFFSVLEDRKLGIQGRQYPLNTNDVVALGTNHYVAGNHVISLQKAEGIFANGRNIYLKDKKANTVTNLSAGSYTFAAVEGLTEGRFEIIYENDIVLGTASSNKDELMVYRDGTDFIVKAASKKISDIEVYDSSGRLMMKLNPNQTEVKIEGQTLINTVYVLKINQNGKVTTRKIIR